MNESLSLLCFKLIIQHFKVVQSMHFLDQYIQFTATTKCTVLNVYTCKY